MIRRFFRAFFRSADVSRVNVRFDDGSTRPKVWTERGKFRHEMLRELSKAKVITFPERRAE